MSRQPQESTMLYLYVKGNAAEALRAVANHGIHPSDRLVGPYVTSPLKTTPTYFVSEFFVKDECEPGIVRWMEETIVLTKTYPGTLPAGTLLHYDKGR